MDRSSAERQGVGGTMTKMKPCPFCGESVKIERNSRGEALIHCENRHYFEYCDEFYFAYRMDDKEIVIGEWNKRFKTGKPIIAQGIVPCPFCGSDNIRPFTGNRIKCKDCGTMTREFDEIQDAWNFWNARSEV